jgi:hypothetical protein
MKNHGKFLALTGLIAALSLAGCWGDSNNNNNEPVPPTASTAVPDSAGVSSTSFVSYILGLSASDEASESLTLKDTLAVPEDESAEPTPLI